MERSQEPPLQALESLTGDKGESWKEQGDAVLKFVHHEVWAFDAEWVPDPATGRIAYGLPEEMPDEEVLNVMWREGGATDEDPRPYLKTALCRVVSIAAVTRSQAPDGTVTLRLHSIPSEADGNLSEAQILDRFLTAVGKAQPQLVGFNSSGADLPILIQRGIARGLHQPLFCRRPERPWEGRDYFARNSDWSVDLKDVLGGWGRSTPSLHEMASSCGIPGKIDVDGGDVVDLWLAGDIRSIAAYNECDALTTYLLWLRIAHFAGFISPEQYRAEQDQLRSLLRKRVEEQGAGHLERFLDRWEANEKRNRD